MWDLIISVPDHCLSVYSAVPKLISLGIQLHPRLNKSKQWRLTKSISKGESAVLLFFLSTSELNQHNEPV